MSLAQGDIAGRAGSFLAQPGLGVDDALVHGRQLPLVRRSEDRASGQLFLGCGPPAPWTISPRLVEVGVAGARSADRGRNGLFTYAKPPEDRLSFSSRSGRARGLLFRDRLRTRSNASAK